MIDFFTNYILTPYFQGILFFVLFGLFFLRQRRATFISTGFNWLRTIILVVLFLYFGWNWASEIPASLRGASVLGMFIINLSMMYNLILGNLEEKYRQALEAYGLEANNKALADNVWKCGKTFLRTRYFFESLLSGQSPGLFLQGIINHQIPLDIQRVLAKHGVAAEILTHQTLLAFLATKLDQSTLLPQEIKSAVAQSLKQFAEHAWIREKIDDFLHLAMTDPKQLTELPKTEQPTPEETGADT